MLFHFLCFIWRKNPRGKILYLFAVQYGYFAFFFFAAAWSSQSPFPLQVFDLLRPPEDVVYFGQILLVSFVFRGCGIFARRVLNRMRTFVWRVTNPFPAVRHYLFAVRQYYCHFSVFIGSSLYQRAKPPQGTVLFINLLRKGLTPKACMGDGGSIWWAPG